MRKLSDAPPDPDAVVLQQDEREEPLAWIVVEVDLRVMLLAYAIERQAGTLIPLAGRLLKSPEVDTAHRMAQELSHALPDRLRH